MFWQAGNDEASGDCGNTKNKRRRKTMGMIKAEDVVGYWTGYQDREIVCTNCITDAEMKDISEGQIITDSEREYEGNLFFCDRCKKRI
jgi:hypothetical protein